MLILQVQVGLIDKNVNDRLITRFYNFYNEKTGQVQYPVTGDSHAFDVFRDEFEDPGVAVDFAAVVSLPFSVESFVPFTEDSSGTVLYEATGEPGEWADAS